MSTEGRAHPSADEMENYLLGRLSSDHNAALEEHLLVCEACQRTCDETREFVTATTSAARALAAQPEPSARSWWRLPFPTAAYACALTALIAVISVGYLRQPVQPQGETVVALSATRSADPNPPAAAAGHSVRLHLDTSSLPPSSKYLVEVVDQSGDRIWNGEFVTSAAAYDLHLNKSLRAGTYWVRVNAPGGAALREYELPVR